MRSFLVFAAILVAAVLCLAGTSGAVQCGWQNNNRKCGDDVCCSRWGWCGTSELHCGAGCQSNCLQCGIKRGRLRCEGERCCSQWGYCGSTRAYCCEGCQSDCRCQVTAGVGDLIEEMLSLNLHNMTTSATSFIKEVVGGN